MTIQTRLSLAEQISAAQAWWKDAGVDLAFLDAPQPWLAPEPDQSASEAIVPPPSEPSKAPPPPPPPQIGGNSADWPQDIQGFTEWWLSADAFDAGGTGPRIPPRGSSGAHLMILVAEPEAGDRDRLLSGPQGQLLENFLRAAGMGSEETYVASVLPRHTPMADWDELAAAGLGEITRHHVALAAPTKLLVLGRNILPLIDHDPTKNHPVLQEINHEAANPVVFSGWDLATLLARTKARSTFWRGWLNWTEGKA